MTLRVLVVDDTVTFRKILSDALADIPGVEVVGTAHHGKMALSRIQSLRPDLVTLDIEMPEMDGYILTKKIKSDPRFNGIPVIMHSSLSGMSNQKLGASVGVDEYVPKFEPLRLSETLARRLGVDTMPVRAA